MGACDSTCVGVSPVLCGMMDERLRAIGVHWMSRDALMHMALCWGGGVGGGRGRACWVGGLSGVGGVEELG